MPNPNPYAPPTGTIAARLTVPQLARIKELAASKGMKPGSYLRATLDALTSKEPEAALLILEEAARVLGLDPETMSTAAFTQAISVLFDAAVQDEGDTDPVGDGTGAGLSRSALAYCAKHGISHAEFRAKKQAAVRRLTAPKAASKPTAPAQLSRSALKFCEKQGITQAEYRARKAAACRRS